MPKENLRILNWMLTIACFSEVAEGKMVLLFLFFNLDLDVLWTVFLFFLLNDQFLSPSLLLFISANVLIQAMGETVMTIM